MFAEQSPIKKRPALELILTMLAMAIAVWIIGTTVNIVRCGWVAIPVVDDWDRWDSYITRNSTAQWLFEQYADHRLAAPRLLFIADEVAFHSRGWFLLVCSFIFQMLTAAMLWRLAGCSYPQRRTERLIQAAVLASLTFSAQQWINFVLPFQVQFVMVYTAAAGTLFLIWMSAARNWNVLWMILSILLGAIATYSMANGVLIFPVALLAGVWMRMPRRWIAVFTASTILIAGSYFYTWHSSQPPTSTALVNRLQSAVVFGLTQLGAPASAAFHRLFVSEKSRILSLLAVLPAGVLVTGLVAALVLLWKRRDCYNNAFGVLVFYGLFLAGTAASIALGRSHRPLSEAYEPRYFTPAYLLWGCMLLIGWPLLRQVSRAALYGLLCVLTLVCVAINQGDILDLVKWWSDLIRLGETAVVDNVTDPVPWSKLYHTPEPQNIEIINQTAIEYLRTHNLSIFSEEWTRWPGIRLNSRFSIDSTPGACEGIFAEIVSIRTPLRPGWRVAGWAWDKKADKTPRYVILADREGKVAGVALTQFIAPPELAVYSPRYKISTWRGYVSGERREIMAYALESDGRSLCAIDSQMLPGGIEEKLTELGVVLPKLAPHISSGWMLNGYFKGPGGPPPHSIGPVYGTYPDNNTGSIQIGTFRLGWNAGIVVPLVTGGDTHDLSIVVRDADTKEVFAKLHPVPVETSWCAWHPDLPPDRELNLEIVAEDNGSGAGEWLAIGWPHLNHRLQ